MSSCSNGGFEPPLRKVVSLNINGLMPHKQYILPSNNGSCDILGLTEHWYIQQSWFINHPSCCVSSVENPEDRPARGHSPGGAAIFVRPSLRCMISWTWSNDAICMMQLGGIIYALAYFRPSWDGTKTRRAIAEMPIKPHVFMGDWNIRFSYQNPTKESKERYSALSEYISANGGNVLSSSWDIPDHVCCFDVAARATKIGMRAISDHNFEIHVSVRDIDPVHGDPAIGDLQSFRFCLKELGKEGVAMLFKTMLHDLTKDLLPDMSTPWSFTDIKHWCEDADPQAVVDSTDEFVLSVIHSVAESTLGTYDPKVFRRHAATVPVSSASDLYSNQPGVFFVQKTKKALRSKSLLTWISSNKGESPHQSTINHFTRIFSLPKEYTQHSDRTDTSPGKFQVNLRLLQNFDAACTMHVVSKYPSGKAPGSDALTNSLLACLLPHSNNNLEPVHPFFIALSNLFKLCVWLGRIPTRWKSAIVHPMPKSNSSYIENSRPIALTVLFRRIFETLLKDCLIFKNHLSQAEARNGKIAMGVIHWSQGGFRAQSSTMCQIATLHDMVIRRLTRMLLFIDLTKAYDSVILNVLWMKLAKRLQDPDRYLLPILDALFTDSSLVVMVNGIPTSPIVMRRGLLQGSILSPLLFNVFIDDLAQTLHKDSPTADPVSLLFADDIVLFSKAWDTLLTSARIVTQWCSLNYMVINEAKSGLVIPPECSSSLTDDLKDQAGLHIDRCHTYKYLGVPFGHRGIRWDLLMKDLQWKISRTLSAITPMAVSSVWSPATRLTILKTFVLCHLQYPAGLLWAGMQGLGDSMDEWKNLEKSYARALCFVFEMPQRDEPSCGLNILYKLSGIPSLSRFVEEYGARTQFHFFRSFANSPVLKLQQNPPSPPWSSGILLPRLLRNDIWTRYSKWADDAQLLATRNSAARSSRDGVSARRVNRPPIHKFLPQDRADWLDSHCLGYLCSCVIPSCRLLQRGVRDYLLDVRNTRFVRWALRWRRGVFAVHVMCPGCRLPFRTSHVGRCKLLSSLVESDPHISEDIAVYKDCLPVEYSVLDAALNHRAVGGFCYLIKQLCLVLKVPLNEV